MIRLGATSPIGPGNITGLYFGGFAGPNIDYGVGVGGSAPFPLVLTQSPKARVARSAKSGSCSIPRTYAAPNDFAARNAVPLPQVGSSTFEFPSTNISKKWRNIFSGFVDGWSADLSVGAEWAFDFKVTIFR